MLPTRGVSSPSLPDRVALREGPRSFEEIHLGPVLKFAASCFSTSVQPLTRLLQLAAETAGRCVETPSVAATRLILVRRAEWHRGFVSSVNTLAS